jgi:IS30 family transposase
MPRSRSHTQKTDDQGRISNTISISERPPSAEDRAVPGHWEGDLIFGSHNSQIATLVERQTRYVMMAKVNSKDTETVINALVKHAHQLPRELYASLTWDRGKEMADHRRFTGMLLEPGSDCWGWRRPATGRTRSDEPRRP